MATVNGDVVLLVVLQFVVAPTATSDIEIPGPKVQPRLLKLVSPNQLVARVTARRHVRFAREVVQQQHGATGARRRGRRIGAGNPLHVVEGNDHVTQARGPDHQAGIDAVQVQATADQIIDSNRDALPGRADAGGDLYIAGAAGINTVHFDSERSAGHRCTHIKLNGSPRKS